MPVYEEIKECKGNDERRKCYGLLSGVIDPLVFDTPKTRKIMIITQQPNKKGQAGKEDLKRNLRKLLDRKIQNPSLNLATSTGDTEGTKETLVEYFGGEFVDSVVNEGEMQGEYYWTHFIKCPYVNGSLDDACALKWISREVKEKQPKLIVTFGSRASGFILRKAEIGDEWKEYLWKRELEGTCQGKEIDLDSLRIKVPTNDSVGRLESRLFVMFHPSPSSRLGGFLNEKLRPGLQSVVRKATATSGVHSSTALGRDGSDP